MKKRCAVCGDTHETNVRLAWRRDSDGKTVNICLACAEAGKVNEKSIDNYTTQDTLYTGEVVIGERKQNNRDRVLANLKRERHTV